METDQSKGKFDRWREDRFAILENGLVISCPDIKAWAKWMEESFANGEHWIAKDEVCGFLISTVFLGINHRFSGPPIWFETKVFPASSDGEFLPNHIKRLECTTKIGAVAGHAAVCEMVRTGEIGE